MNSLKGNDGVLGRVVRRCAALILAFVMVATLAVPLGVLGVEEIPPADAAQAASQGETAGAAPVPGEEAGPAPVEEEPGAPAEEEASDAPAGLPAEAWPEAGESDVAPLGGDIEAFGPIEALAVTEVATWADFIAKINDTSVTDIRIIADISGTTSPSKLSRSLNIDGGGHVIGFNSSSTHSADIPLDNSGAGTLTLRNMRLASSTSSTIVSASAGAGWTVNLDNVTENASGSVACAIVSIPSGTVNVSGNVTLNMTKDYRPYIAKRLHFTGGTQNYNLIHEFTKSSIDDFELVADGGARVSIYCRDDNAISMTGKNSWFRVKDGAELNISSCNSGESDAVGVIRTTSNGGGLEITAGGKLRLYSLAGKADAYRNGAKVGMPAYTAEAANQSFVVDGEGSELYAIGYGSGSSSGRGAVMRWRNPVSSNIHFYARNGAKITVIKDQRDQDAIGSPYYGAAVRFGDGANNGFHAESGAVIHIENYGIKEAMDPPSGYAAGNAAIEFAGPNDVFEVTGEHTTMEIIAHKGAAVMMNKDKKDCSISVKDRAILVVEGRTKTAEGAIFRGNENLTFETNNPLYYDFVNKRPGGGKIFKATGDCTYTQVNADMAVWKIGTNAVSGDPWKEWSLLNFTLTGKDFTTIFSVDGSSAFNSYFNSDGDNFGASGMAVYTRINGNNAEARAKEMVGPTNADKYVRVLATVPEGLYQTERPIWSGEAWGRLEYTKNGKSAPEAGELHTTTSIMYESIWDEQKLVTEANGDTAANPDAGYDLAGVVRYDKGSFLVPGDKYKLTKIWRGPYDDPADKAHASSLDDPATAGNITSQQMTVLDVSPPKPVALSTPTETYFKGRTAAISGTYGAQDAWNPEPPAKVAAILVPDGTAPSEEMTLDTHGIKSGGSIVYGTLSGSSAGGTWSYTVPADVAGALHAGDRIYIVAIDANGNANPVVDTPFHDAVFPAAPYLVVAEGLTDFSKKVTDASGKPLESLTISDKNADIPYVLSAKAPSDLSQIAKMEIIDTFGAGLKLKGGSTANVAVKVNGAAANPAPDSVTYNASTKTLTVLWNNDAARSRLNAFAGRTITVEVVANLDIPAAGEIPSSIHNNGSIKLNDELFADEDNPPVVEIRGKISGYLFNDDGAGSAANKGNGLRDPGESAAGYPGTVKLFLADGTTSAGVPDAEVARDGSYSFENLTPGTYVVQFPAVSGKGFTTRQAITVSNGSHADNSGRSPGLTISRNVSGSLEYTANAGYVAPTVYGPGEGGLQKELKKIGSTTVTSSAQPITDSAAELTYEITYQMPPNTAGYNAIELWDVMSPGLTAVDRAGAVAVTAPGVTLKAAPGYPKYEKATTGPDAGKWIVKYKLADDTDFAQLAGKLITMTVVAKIAKVNADETELGSDHYPTTVTNIGRLLVNGGGGGNEQETPPNVKANKNRIYGYVFVDTDYSGTMNGSEKGLSGVNVTLQQWDGSAYVAYAPQAGDTVTTGASGLYEFYVPDGRYQLVFPTPFGAGKMGITALGGSAEYTSGVLPGIEVDIDPATAAPQEKRIDAGYNAPNPGVVSSLEGSFKKYVWEDKNGDGAVDAATEWVAARNITNSGETLTYKIKFDLPADLSKMQGFSSIQIEDVMPAGLTLASGAGNVVVKVGGDTVYSSAAGAQAGRTASYTFDAAAIEGWISGGKAGAEVSMTVKAVLEKVDGAYKATVTNKGRMTINAGTAAQSTQPASTVNDGVKITGTLWYDTGAGAHKGNGRMDADEAPVGAGKTVTLYAASNLTAAVATAVTDADGQYVLDKRTDGTVIPAGTYVVQYPAIVDYSFVKAGSSNVVDSAGRSGQITLDLDTHQSRVSDAGYISAAFFDTDDPSAFTKKVTGVSGTAVIDEDGSTVTTTAPQTDVITYTITVKMPDDLYPYSTDAGAGNGVDIRDIMGNGLALEGAASSVAVKADGKALTAGVTKTWTAATGTLSVKIVGGYDAVMKGLEGKTVTVDVPAKVQAAGGVYPSSVSNDAKVYLNGSTAPPEGGEIPDDKKPEVLIKGKISGYLFKDANGDGKYLAAAGDGDVKLAGKAVELLNADGTFFFAAMTDAEGAFSFVVDVADGGSAFLIKAPAGAVAMAGDADAAKYGYTTRQAMSVPNGSHVGNDGRSGQLSLKRTAGGADLAKTVNAGYAKAAVTEGDDAFQKTLVKVGETATDGPITDASADLTYEIRYVMPASTAGYNAIEIKDIMSPGLVLKDSSVANVAVSVDGMAVAGGTKAYAAGTGVDAGKMVASYKFADDYDFSTLAGKTIVMTVVARLTKVNAAGTANGSDHWPTDVKNTARLSVNDAQGPVDREETEQNIARIHGMAFADTNRNGVKDGAEKGLSGVAVTLKRWDGSAYVAYTPPAVDGKPNTNPTDIGGYYSFYVPAGRYQIEFPTPFGADHMGITTSGDGYAPVTGIVPDIELDIDPDTAAVPQTRKIDVGYGAPISNVLEDIKNSFSKKVKNGADYVAGPEKTVSDFSETLEYKIGFPIPAAPAGGAATFSGFASIELVDVMQQGLALATDNVAADVDVYVNGTKVTDGASSVATLAQDAASKTIRYTISAEQIGQYLSGRPAAGEVYMIVRAKLVKYDTDNNSATPDDWPTSVTNKGRLIVNGVDPTKDLPDTEVSVAGLPPVITFTEYPLVLAQTAGSHILTKDELKAGMQVTDDVDNPTWEDTDKTGGGAAQALWDGTTAASVGIAEIDQHNIGVYKVSYTATDSNGNTAMRARAVVITDGRYIIDVTDDGDDTNDIIIGARNFVAKASSIDGTETDAKSRSYAEAFDGGGEKKDVKWTGAPKGYVGNGGTAPGDYRITWTADGFTAKKTITATIVNADEVYPGYKYDQYAIVASHFLRNRAQAEAMMGAGLDDNLIAAANARVFKLVEDTPGNPPLADREVIVLTRGSEATGPFRNELNTYPIDFAIAGLPSFHVPVNGIVSDGQPPVLTVPTPKEVAKGGVYGAAQYMEGVVAIDPDGEKNGSTNPADHRAKDITDQVKYGTLNGVGSAATLTEGTPVKTANPGLYGVDYRVVDSDGNKADKHRVVIVNDGSYVVQGNILQAHSFVTIADEVTKIQANIKSELRSKAGAKAFNGATGIPFDLSDENVVNTGGYHAAAGTYDVTFAAPDAPSGSITKTIQAKVVDADVIEEGPENPPAGDTDRYFVYGNNIVLTTSQAQAILGAPDYKAALIAALGAHADKVTAAGVFSDARATIENDGGFSASNGIYNIIVKDAGGHVSCTLTATVSSGNAPELAVAPVPLIIDAVASPVGNLTKAQIYSGVTVKDAEDTAGAVTAWDALPAAGPQVGITGGDPVISANVKSVTKVTYSYTDADGNKATVSRAIVVNDGRYKIDDKYILEANSFVIGKSAVDTADPRAQVVAKSGAKAWRIDGTPAVAEVKDLAGYKDEIGSYGITMTVQNHADLTKQIEARVYDDSTPSGGGGEKGENGDRYSILASNFRVNLRDAKAWQGDTGVAFDAHFIGRSAVTAFLRATLQTNLVESGTPKLEKVVKDGAPGTAFAGAQLSEGDVFLATFYVNEEPATKVTVRVLVSDGNAPKLTVPDVKSIGLGDPFPEGAYADAAPSYRQGVSASDVEDGPIAADAISHDTPVDPQAKGKYEVTYSVKDSDHNEASEKGYVLVGFVLADGYAISADDFTKSIGDVLGTEQEAVDEAHAVAYDMRRYLDDAKARPNPDFGAQIDVVVADDGGYYGKAPGSFDITFAVKKHPEAQVTITATVGAGSGPAITFTEYPLVLAQSAASQILTAADLKAAMQVTDAEDNPTWEETDKTGGGTAQALWDGTTATPVGIAQIDRRNIGVYKVRYTAKDQHGNQTTRTRAVVITDGRYIIDVTDDDDDTNDIIIGARNFVAKASSIDGTETQARSLSYAEAYDGYGDKLGVKWTGAPKGYVGNGGTAPGEYRIKWTVDGYTASKTITATIVNADEVYPGLINDQYAIAANHFLKNRTQAAAMMGAGLDANLIAAANARVFKLVEDTPGNPPLADRGVVVVTYGSEATGPFRDELNTYPIEFAVEGLPSSRVTVNGIVSDGYPPVLTVPTPKEVEQGGTYGAAQYMEGVVAVDPDGDKNGSTDPADHTAKVITDQVQYGTLSGVGTSGTFTAGTPVKTANPGLYGVDYRVVDSDGNIADGHRVVIVNDGSYVVQGNILKANSFVTKAEDVTTFPSNIKSELRSKSGARAYDGATGIPFDLSDDNVTNTGGYRAAAGIYDVTFTVPDVPTGKVVKTIQAKVVDAEIIVEGPENPPEGDTDRYFVYGNNIVLTTSQAQAILDAGDYKAALLAALDAHADRVTGAGDISDAAAVIDDDGGFGTANGIYDIIVKDAGGHVSCTLTATVSSGNAPELAVTPVLLVIDAVDAPVGNLMKAQIYSGVTVKDAEDTAGAVTAWDALPAAGPQVSITGGDPVISANANSVTKVTYNYTDRDGNPATASRAIMVNDGRYKYDDKYILEANSFVIGKSAVDTADPRAQVVARSSAKAWKVDGTPVMAEVKDLAGYRAEIGSYGILMGIAGYADMTKQIEARVYDDSTPSGGGGEKGENGDRYSILASNFRVNLTDAKVWQGDAGEAFDAHFLMQSAVKAYLRATLQTNLVESGTPKLEKVVKDGDPGTAFAGAQLFEGDVFLATYYVHEEPATKVTVRVLVSDGNAPKLTVPDVKGIGLGDPFPEGAFADEAPSYRQGVAAADVEDGSIAAEKISHDSPVDPQAKGKYEVTYSVTDSDYNTVEEIGYVLVGFEILGGYAISADDFEKTIGEVLATEQEAIDEANAVAYDMRRYLDDAKSQPNPDFGEAVAVKVADDGGYYGKAPGSFDITFAVKKHPETQVTITATVDAGSGPAITFTEYPLVLTQTAAKHILTKDELKAGMQVTDAEDNPTWEEADKTGGGTAQALWDGTTAVPVGIAQIDQHNIGVYAVRYRATDAHDNVTERTRAVVITDGRYVIDVTDDGDDTNDIILGARNFVAKSASIDGTETQARSLSYAEAYDGAGGKKDVKWTGAPEGYVGGGGTAPGEYRITWTVDGYAATKAITATIVNADEVYPGLINDQYAIVANHFLRNRTQAAAMMGADLDANLIAAARARVFKLVEDAPGNPPLADRGVVVVRYGSDATGPFCNEPNTYPIDFAIAGLPDSHVVVNGIVSDGQPPILTVTTPKEVDKGEAYGKAQYMEGVTAIDPDGDKHGTPDPGDDTPVDITDQVKYGTLVGAVFTEGTPVNPANPGVYGVDYRVTDDDFNTADKHRVVIVNDGSYVVQGNILKANSFVTKAEDVTTNEANIKAELRSKAGAKAYDGATGIPFDLGDDNVMNTGGYRAAAGTYDVTFSVPDAPTGTVVKTIQAKVVDADIIVEGPEDPPEGDTDRYFVYGNNIELTTSKAQAILDAADYEKALLAALDAHADKVTGAGEISDAAAVIDDDGGFSTENGIYSILVKDAGGHTYATLTATVSSGNAPTLAATPIPLIIDTADVSGENLTKAEIYKGVTVKDFEDTGDVVTAWDALPAAGPQVTIVGGDPVIPAQERSVTKVTYSYTDTDGNPVTVSRAIVVNDGRYKIDDKYILEANSFIIGKSQVDIKEPQKQIVEKSSAKAWKIDGTPTVAEVKELAGYRAEIGSYGVVIGIAGYADMTKQIEARVYDDSTPPDGGGEKGENGDRYSILAKNFRVNLTDAKAWQKDTDEAYDAHFLAKSGVTAYLRATLQTNLVKSGTPKLEQVVKDGDPSRTFKDAALAEGGVFLATFYVDEEPATKVTVRVLVSDGNAPVLKIAPETQIVSLGSAYGDAQYRQGVTATDVEDGVLTGKVTYTGSVNTNQDGGVFTIAYSVMDSDYNVATKNRTVLVGDGWIIDPQGEYAIYAHGFSKQAGEVNGTEAQAIAYAGAKAIDLRQAGSNPNYGKAVPVVVKNDGGYYSKMPGAYQITFAVKAKPSVAVTVAASVGKGEIPVLTVEPPMLQIELGDAYGDNQYKSGVTATDAEDGDITRKVTYDRPVDPDREGSYTITYSVTDSHGNKVTKTRTVYVVDNTPQVVYVPGPAGPAGPAGPTTVVTRVIERVREVLVPEPAPEIEPEVIAPEPEPVEIPDAPAPVADYTPDTSWSLLNMILTILAVAIAVFLGATLYRRRKQGEEINQRDVIGMVTAAVASVASVCVLLLTSDFNAEMSVADNYSAIFAIFVAVAAIGALLPALYQKRSVVVIEDAIGEEGV